MEEDFRAVLEERVEKHGFYIDYDPVGDGMCFYNAAGSLLGKPGYCLKAEIFDYLKRNRFNASGEDRLNYIDKNDIGGEELPNSYEKALALLENNWANYLVVTILPMLYKRTVTILTGYGKKPKDYFITFEADDSTAPPIYLGYTGVHYVALKERSQDSNDQKTSTDDLKQEMSPNSERLTMLTYMVKVKKRGLTQEELHDPVMEKLDQLCGILDIKLGLKGSVKEVVKDICLTEAKKTGDLDKRRRSIEEYPKEKILPSGVSPKQWHKSQSGEEGKQGKQKPSKQVVKEYHRVQHELFLNEWLTNEQFKDIFCVEGGEIQSVEVGVSSLFFIPENPCFLWRRLSPEEFCNVLDKITIRYLQGFDIIVSSKEKARKVYSLCRKVAMGRFAGNMMVDSDLMNTESSMSWRYHVLVIISFTALCAVLHKLYRKLERSSSDQVVDSFKQLTTRESGDN